MLTLAAGIIMLGILVFVHELGHFCVAKLCGVRVLKFSLGFGPKLFSRKLGETEYLICAVPLGGYVQMLGEGGGESGEGIELTPEDAMRSFAGKPVGQRTAIVAAGPLMNLLLPFLVLPAAYLVGINLPAFLDQPACIGFVVAGSEGEKAGFQSGDCIVALNGDTVSSWDQTNRALVTHAGSPLSFAVDRQGSEQQVKLTPADGGLEGVQSFGLFPRQEALVGAVADGMPAQTAGLLVGDRIVAIDDQTVESWYDLKNRVKLSGGESQAYLIERNGERLTLMVKSVKSDDNGENFMIGIAPLQQTVVKRFGLLEAIKAGAHRSLDLIELTLVFVQKLISGHVPSRSIGGPITVVQIAGQAAQTDFSSILTVLAFLSIQLGILNLLPVPILDGGHLFFNLFEILFRRPLSLRTREIAQQVGLILIVLLMLLAFYNDIVRLLLGWQQ